MADENKIRHEKDLEVSLLLDFYGELLSEKKREAAEFYYNEDFSLSEIAENMGITRQGVRDNVEKARVQLYSFEDKLGLVAKLREINDKLSDILPRLERLRSGAAHGVQSELDEIINEVKTITI